MITLRSYLPIDPGVREASILSIKVKLLRSSDAFDTKISAWIARWAQLITLRLISHQSITQGNGWTYLLLSLEAALTSETVLLRLRLRIRL
jgi:hypothetical protein